MESKVLKAWFRNLQRYLEETYLAQSEPWQQSGFSGPQERWAALRKPIADCVDKDGTFLDIGCANGYLLECVVSWSLERGIRIVPFGLDISPRLIALAQERLPSLKPRLFVGNAFYWTPNFKFDFVRTELAYVPAELQREYVQRLLAEFVSDGGKLLIAEYRSRGDAADKPWADDHLDNWRIPIKSVVSARDKGKELTRIAVIQDLGSLNPGNNSDSKIIGMARIRGGSVN